MKNLLKCITIIGLVIAVNADYVGAWPWSKNTDTTVEEIADEDDLEQGQTKISEADLLKNLKQEIPQLETAQKNCEALARTILDIMKKEKKNSQDLSFLKMFRAMLFFGFDELQDQVDTLKQLSTNISTHISQIKNGREEQVENTVNTIANLLQYFLGAGENGTLSSLESHCIMLLQYMLKVPKCPKAGIDTLMPRIIKGRGLKVLSKNKPLSGVIADAVISVKALKKTLSGIVSLVKSENDEFEISEQEINYTISKLISVLNFFTTPISYMAENVEQDEIKTKLNEFTRLNVKNLNQMEEFVRLSNGINNNSRNNSRNNVNARNDRNNGYDDDYDNNSRNVNRNILNNKSDDNQNAMRVIKGFNSDFNDWREEVLTREVANG